MKFYLTLLILPLAFWRCNAQNSGQISREEMGNSTMDFETYNPPSSLVVPEHPVTRAKFPFIDVHNHQL